MEEENIYKPKEDLSQQDKLVPDFIIDGKYIDKDILGGQDE